MSHRTQDPFSYTRSKMVNELEKRGITDEKVLQAFGVVPRHLFISEAFNYRAYDLDRSLPIGFGQTISAPLTVAKMLQAAKLQRCDSVLEVGSGSGYQTVLLSLLCQKVTATERIRELYERSENLLLNNFLLKNVNLYYNEEYFSLKQKFDVIIFACGAESLPNGITNYLNLGGRLVIPIGQDKKQQLKVYTLTKNKGLFVQNIGKADFVPYIN